MIGSKRKEHPSQEGDNLLFFTLRNTHSIDAGIPLHHYIEDQKKKGITIIQDKTSRVNYSQLDVTVTMTPDRIVTGEVMKKEEAITRQKKNIPITGIIGEYLIYIKPNQRNQRVPPEKKKKSSRKKSASNDLILVPFDTKNLRGYKKILFTDYISEQQKLGITITLKKVRMVGLYKYPATVAVAQDGTSIGVIMEEKTARYRQKSKKPITLSLDKYPFDDPLKNSTLSQSQILLSQNQPEGPSQLTGSDELFRTGLHLTPSPLITSEEDKSMQSLISESQTITPFLPVPEPHLTTELQNPEALARNSRPKNSSQLSTTSRNLIFVPFDTKDLSGYKKITFKDYIAKQAERGIIITKEKAKKNICRDRNHVTIAVTQDGTFTGVIMAERTACKRNSSKKPITFAQDQYTLIHKSKGPKLPLSKTTIHPDAFFPAAPTSPRTREHTVEKDSIDLSFLTGSDALFRASLVTPSPFITSEEDSKFMQSLISESQTITPFSPVSGPHLTTELQHLEPLARNSSPKNSSQLSTLSKRLIFVPFDTKDLNGHVRVPPEKKKKSSREKYASNDLILVPFDTKNLRGYKKILFTDYISEQQKLGITITSKKVYVKGRHNYPSTVAATQDGTLIGVIMKEKTAYTKPLRKKPVTFSRDKYLYSDPLKNSTLSQSQILLSQNQPEGPSQLHTDFNKVPPKLPLSEITLQSPAPTSPRTGAYTLEGDSLDLSFLTGSDALFRASLVTPSPFITSEEDSKFMQSLISESQTITPFSPVSGPHLTTELQHLEPLARNSSPKNSSQLSTLSKRLIFVPFDTKDLSGYKKITLKDYIATQAEHGIIITQKKAREDTDWNSHHPVTIAVTQDGTCTGIIMEERTAYNRNSIKKPITASQGRYTLIDKSEGRKLLLSKTTVHPHTFFAAAPTSPRTREHTVESDSIARSFLTGSDELIASLDLTPSPLITSEEGSKFIQPQITVQSPAFFTPAPTPQPIREPTVGNNSLEFSLLTPSHELSESQRDRVDSGLESETPQKRRKK